MMPLCRRVLLLSVMCRSIARQRLIGGLAIQPFDVGRQHCRALKQFCEMECHASMLH